MLSWHTHQIVLEINLKGRPLWVAMGKKNKKIILLVFAIFYLGLGLASAFGDDNPFTKDLIIYRRLAEAGDPEGQYQLGKHFDYGRGVKQDGIKAAYWYEKAALQGHIEAQHSLGMLNNSPNLYIFANGKESVKWLRAAAEQGHAPSQHFLGRAYEAGNAVPRNYEEAAEWYKLAAFQGNGMAMYHLAVFYAEGQGVQKDLIKAYAWNNVSAAQGWGMAKSYREELEKLMSPEQLKKSQKLSLELMKDYGQVENW